MKHKYPIGTRIKYRGCCSPDVGKEGRIVGYLREKIVEIVIIESQLALKIYGDSSHSWTTDISSLEVLSIPNQQLLFGFMYYE